MGLSSWLRVSTSAVSTRSGPAHVLRSSKDRYQILWDTVREQWDQEQAEAVMRALADRYGGDRAAQGGGAQKGGGTMIRERMVAYARGRWKGGLHVEDER